MSKPALTDLVAGQENAHTTINGNHAKLTGAPFPIKEYADYSALSAVSASAHDRCLAVTASPPMLWISTGGSWVPTGIMVAVHQTSALSGASYTWANAFPAGVRQIGVAGRVTTTVTGATSTNVGDHGASDPDRYAAAVALAAGTTFADVATADPGGWNAAARDVVLTAVGSNFTGGVFRLYAFYLATFAPIS